MTVRQIYKYGVDFLHHSQIENCEFEAKELLLYVLEINNTSFLLNGDASVSQFDTNSYTSLLKRRAKGEPLQYIIGKWSFLNCNFFVGEGVLIPRPETEQLTQMCIEKIKRNNIKVAYDLCAGSGCIGISIAKECKDTKVFLFEKYSDAINYLNKNIELNSVKNAKAVSWDILDGIPCEISLPGLIVSNPPYIPSALLPNLQREVQFEPATALDGGEDGLDFYRVICNKWLSPLKKTAPSCFIECGEEQSENISDLFSAFGEVRIHKDIFGVERFVELS